MTIDIMGCAIVVRLVRVHDVGTPSVRPSITSSALCPGLTILAQSDCGDFAASSWRFRTLSQGEVSLTTKGGFKKRTKKGPGDAEAFSGKLLRCSQGRTCVLQLHLAVALAPALAVAA